MNSSKILLWKKKGFFLQHSIAKRSPKGGGGGGGTGKRGGGGGTGKRGKHFSTIEGDFGGSYSHRHQEENVYRDFYGGRGRHRMCQRRSLRVSFRELGWQVRNRNSY